MFQRVSLIGYVGQDPEMRYTESGVPVTSFSLATKETISKSLPDGGERPCPNGWKESYNGRNWEVTTWWRVTCWRGLAETVTKYVGKGRMLFVEGVVQGEAHDGALNPRVWTGQDGTPRASFELRADTVKFLGDRGENGGSAGGPPAPTDEDLPF